MNHIEDFEKEVKHEVQNAEIVVDDPASMEIASEMVINLDNMKKRVVDYWAVTKKNAYDAWKNITAKEKEMLDPIDAARDGLKRKINFYLTEQKRKEDEERRKAEEKRRADEESERIRLAEDQRKAEEEKAVLLAEGKVEEAEAKSAEIEMIQDAVENVYIPVEIPEESLQKTTRTDTGTVSGTSDIEIEIRDKKAVIQAMLADGLVDSIKITESELKKYIKLRGLKSYPGIGIKEVVRASFRGKRPA